MFIDLRSSCLSWYFSSGIGLQTWKEALSNTQYQSHPLQCYIPGAPATAIVKADGEVKLPIRNHRNSPRWPTVTLKNVLYVPGLPHSLLSSRYVEWQTGARRDYLHPRVLFKVWSPPAVQEKYCGYAEDRMDGRGMVLQMGTSANPDGT